MALARSFLGDLEKARETEGPKTRPSLDIGNSIDI